MKNKIIRIYPIIVLLLAAAVFSGCSLLTVYPSFDYSDEYGTEEYDYGIIFYGDTRKHNDVHMDMVENIFAFDPEAVFHLGDMVDDGDSDYDWEVFDAIVEELVNTVPFYPVVGNHEKGVDPEEYSTRWDVNVGLSFYSLDLRKNGDLAQVPINQSGESDYSSINIDNVAAHLVVLNVMPDYLDKGGEQYNWLIADLLQYTEIPKILIFHIGLYMAGVHAEEVGEYHSSPVLYEIVSDEEFNIVACINGHDHAYERFNVNGTLHIATGCAGESPIELVQPNHPYLVTSEAVRHLSIMKPVENTQGDVDSLQFTVFDIDLNIIDEFNIPLE